VLKLPESKRRTELSQWLVNLEQGFDGRVLPFTQKTAHVWAEMTTQAEQQGKPMLPWTPSLQPPLCLVTRNVRDFTHAGVPLLDPWQVSA
jgi:predicted nucleic acid-binding protein